VVPSNLSSALATSSLPVPHMSIFFKFKSAKEGHSVRCDDAYLTLGELKYKVPRPPHSFSGNCLATSRPLLDLVLVPSSSGH